NSRTGVRFPCGTTEAVTVRITAVDIAGNRTEVTKDYPAAGTGQSTSLSPPNIAAPPVKTDAGTGAGMTNPNIIVPPPALDPMFPGGPIAPSGGPISPSGGPIASPPLPKNPVEKLVQPDVPPLVGNTNPNPGVGTGSSGVPSAPSGDMK